MSYKKGKFAGRGKLTEGSLKDSLFSGSVKTLDGIKTRTNDAIKRAYVLIRNAAIKWVNTYVPMRTGVLRAAFIVDPTINLAGRGSELIKMQLKMAFPAYKFPDNKPYAKYVDEMRGVHLTTAGTITPFWGPLIKYMNDMVPKLLIEAFRLEGLAFDAKNMKVKGRL